MDNETDLLEARLRDLAERSYRSNIYTNTLFLSAAEQETFFRNQRELSYAHPTVFGGRPESERRIVRFGSTDMLGYDEEYPITALLIEPLQLKFSDELTHRDFLGAVLNLGIERSLIGDILIRPEAGVMFVMNHIADMIKQELTRIRHTSVKISEISAENLDSMGFRQEYELIATSVSSLRADALVAHVIGMSRGHSQQMFKVGYVTLNGRVLEKYETEMKPGDIFTVRGHGKYVFDGETGNSRKGKIRVEIRRYK